MTHSAPSPAGPRAGEVVAGIDLGGTNIKVGLVSASGEITHRHSAETHAESGPEAVAERMCETARRCMASAALDAASVRGVGVGSPGTIDLDSGVVLFSPNLPEWHDVPLRRMLEERLGLPITLDNDANVAALAEQWVGAGRGASSLVLLTLGTGIGGGIILEGRIWHGANGVAGEIGHMSIDPEGPRCACGNRGCFESYASASAMVRRMHKAVHDGAQSTLADRLGDLTARDIHTAALAGDEAARENIEATGRYLGVGISNILHIVNPEVVALSGGVTAAGEMLMAPLLDEMRQRTMAASQRDVKICFAELPNDAGVIGAARSFMLARP
jgi:glucokinase